MIDALKDGFCLSCNKIIEIASQPGIRMDYYIKRSKYRNAGVRGYWIVDPEKSRIMVYGFEHDTVAEYTFSDKVKAGLYEDLEIDSSGIRVG